MLGALSVLAGVGIVCGTGAIVSSAFKFFHTYEYDLTKKINDSKNKAKKEREIGGENHESRMEKLSGRITK